MIRELGGSMSHEDSSVADLPWAAARTLLLQEFGKGLHDLCQPITTLHCRLYLGSTEEQPEALLEAFRECLLECEQVILSINQLQRRLGDLRSGLGDEG
jgi:hypothetical protein